MRRTLRYNEQKVEENKALFLDAHNYWQEKEDLSLEDKLQRLQDLASLNERSKAHCIHISVNFHPRDQITDKEMVNIAAQFMKDIGFEDQPWLVYRHIDAGHPHLHIVTTNIRLDGSRISNDLRSPHRLKEICQYIEIRHNLMRARRQGLRLPDVPPGQGPEYPKRLKYGEMPTKTGIAQVLEHTINKYTYTSLDHLNALLGLYNVRVDRSSAQGAMYPGEGLYYRIIDAEGKKMGAPIKASALYSRPTLRNLQEKFWKNLEKEHRSIRHIDDAVLLAHAFSDFPSLDYFRNELWKKRILLVIPALRQRPTRQQPQNTPSLLPDDGHGFFYIDHNDSVVLRDTQLGKENTAAAILTRYKLDQTLLQLVAQDQIQVTKTIQQSLNSPDTARQRNALLRLTPQHDRWEAQQEEQREAHRQAHRIRISF